MPLRVLFVKNVEEKGARANAPGFNKYEKQGFLHWQLYGFCRRLVGKNFKRILSGGRLFFL